MSESAEAGVCAADAELPVDVLVDEGKFIIEIKAYYDRHSKKSKKLEWTPERIIQVIKLLDEYQFAKSQGKRPTNQQYHHAIKYDVMNIGNRKILILKKKDISDPVVQIIPTEEYYQTILDAHICTGHGRRDKILHALRDKFLVPIFAIKIFLNLCTTCLSKKSFPKTGIVVKPIISEDFNRRGQVDLVDFQTSPDEEYKWLLQYQDHLTKFCFLRPLKSKQAREVAVEILKIFLEVGCPHILQSDNGREFTASVLKEIVSLWPACKIVNGRPRYPQSQGSIERSNQDVKNMIRAWMVDNKSTNWSIGCYFVQFQKNSSYHSTIARTPYKALFGQDPQLGLASSYLSKNIISKLETEEDVERVFGDINNNEEQSGIVNLDQQEEFLEIVIVDQVNLEVLPRTPDTSISLNILAPEVNVALDEASNSRAEHTDNNIDEAVPNKEIDDLMCCICNKETSGAHTCVKCKQAVHTICGVASEENEGYGSQVLCNLCLSERNIVQGRQESHKNLKRMADKMIATSSKKFKDISVGSSVLVEVPKVDRGPLDSKNIIGKVIGRKNELYQIGTAFGVIKDWMPRNAVVLSPLATLLNDIPKVTLPLRTIASMSSSFGGQGMKQCNCKKITKGQCVSNKCYCKKANVLCNSRCHSSLTCNNK